MLKKILPVVALIALTGCATSKYQCELGNECVDVYDIYGATLENGGNKETVIPDLDRSGVPFDKKSKGRSQGGTTSLGLQSFEPYAGGAMTDKPIYQPPSPLRIWIAPWQTHLDSETQQQPVLMSGQFMYVTIPGFWTMGELQDRGDLGGPLLLEPFDSEKAKKKAPTRIQPRQEVFNISGN